MLGMVFMCATQALLLNWWLDTNLQLQEATSPQVLRSGQFQR